MAVQPLRQEDSLNPRTSEEARTLAKHVELLFMPWNLEALADGLTEDCIVRFGSVPSSRAARPWAPSSSLAARGRRTIA